MPYNPQIEYQSLNPHVDTGRWGAVLMQLLGQKDAKAEQAKKDASEFKTYVAMGKQIGLNPDELTTQDLPTVKGMVEGHITKSNLERIMEESKRNQQTFDRQTASEEALAKAMQSAGTAPLTMPSAVAPDLFPPMQGQQTVPVTPERLMQAMQQNPQAVNARGGAGLLERAMVQSPNGSPVDFMPQPFEVNGLKGLVSPRTGSIHVAGGGNAATSTDDRLKVESMKALNARKNIIMREMGKPQMPDTRAFFAQELAAINEQLGGSATSADDGPAESDIAYLKANPNMKQAFEKRFGAGTAQQYLK